MGMPVFLKKAKEAGASSVSEPVVRKPDDGAEYDMLQSASDDLIAAVHSKDAKATCEALRAAFEILQSEQMPFSDEETE